MASSVIQWLESWRQREDLKLVFNRRMRTRMYGGVGGVRSDAAPIPIGIVIRRIGSTTVSGPKGWCENADKYRKDEYHLKRGKSK